MPERFPGWRQITADSKPCCGRETLGPNLFSIMATNFHLKSLCHVLLLLGVVNVGVLGKRSKFHRVNAARANMKYADDKELLAEAVRNSGDQECVTPQLAVYHPDIMKFVKDTGPLVCSNITDWVMVNGSVAFITEEARQKFGSIECFFRDIIRENDNSVYFGVTTKVINEYHLEESDFVDVLCISDKGKIWRNVMAGIRHDQGILNRTGWNVKDGLQLNVLIWGFDSLSRNMFARKLPKTHRYMNETLGAIELKGYNIVGDGTPEALIPMLTGYTEQELPETGKSLGSKAAYVNVYPFIWNDFRDRGYVTGYAEDYPEIGTFTFRLKGFDTAPTDHYMRPFYLQVSSVKLTHSRYCLGSVPRHKVMMNYIHNFFKVYPDKPKFMFAFHGELSHDSYNEVGAADEDMKQWLQTLYEDGHLNSTLLIIMSDHGPRFSEFRNTLQGKQEERLPMFSLILPEWFSRVHPAAFVSLRRNIKRLTTPFDVHQTLANVLHFDGVGPVDVTKRSISLFQKIPPERSCADAYIEPHWCACYDWQVENIHDRNVIQAAYTVVDFINQITEKKRELCSLVKLDAILTASKLAPKQALLNVRRKSNGGVDFSDKTRVPEVLYQLTLRVKPGAALYEVTLTHKVRKGVFLIRTSDISRINRYAPFAYCVEKTYHDLRKYCFCRKKSI